MIADDGSTDGTRDYVKQLEKEEKWIGKIKYCSVKDCNTNRRGKIRNFGVGNLPESVNYILFLDSDIILNEFSIEHYHKLLTIEPKIVVFGKVDWLPPLSFSEVSEMLSCNGFKSLNEKIPDGPQERIEGTYVGKELREKVLFNDSDLKLVDGRWALFTNTAMMRETFVETGGFDEQMHGYGYEDMEIGHRFQNNSIECRYSDKALGLHIWHPKEDTVKNHLENQKNLSYLVGKHGWDEYYYNDVDWEVPWHYQRKNGGEIYCVEGNIWAVSYDQKHRIPEFR